MDPLALVGAFGVLGLTLCLGTVAHEYAHALALRAFGVDYRIDWFGDRSGADRLRAGLLGTWASVTPLVSAETSPLALRIAGLMPLTLLFPFVLVSLGLVPDPLAIGHPLVVAAAVGWLACALPSPADFSTVWYAHRLVEERRTLAA